MRALRAALPCVVVAGLLGGCASEPPVPTASSAPEPGDSVEQVVQRGYLVKPVYVFEVAGHEYAFATTRSEWSSQALILIDGKLACIYSFEIAGSGLLEWEWAGEPDGLAYLASRVRQACRLEPETPSRTLPSLAAPATDASASVSEEPHTAGSADPPIKKGSGAASEAATMLGQILIGVPLGILAAPYVIIGSTAALIVGSPFIIAENSANQHQLERREQMRLGLTREETAALLGKPEIEFPLPSVDTTVLMYEAGKGTKYYVGLENDRVIWIHDQYKWLNQLAKLAKETEKRPH